MLDTKKEKKNPMPKGKGKAPKRPFDLGHT